MDELRGFNEDKLCRKMFMDDDEFENSKIEFLVLEPVAPKIILKFFCCFLHNFCFALYMFFIYIHSLNLFIYYIHFLKWENLFVPEN